MPTSREALPALPVPDLPADEDALVRQDAPPRAGGDHDGELFPADLDLTGVDAHDSRLLGCVVRSTRADGFRLAGARLVDCRVAGLGATEALWRNGTWRDTIVQGCRVGALDLSGASWNRVLVQGGRVDFANLRATELVDVTFDGVDLRDLDLGAARLVRVRFVDCRIGHLDVTGARLQAVDLSGSELTEGLDGVGDLRGAVVSSGQLLQLGPLFAEHLGVRVRD
ncbi:pentapeptide repeat-containing protein [Kineococcus sp. NPDC059986]|uniref:pentapeptide repeat-containing protein n=1 Tax=Kineococcus sp. NPDC059986 TaxID=3155538 RepID=UPI00344EB7D0